MSAEASLKYGSFKPFVPVGKQNIKGHEMVLFLLPVNKIYIYTHYIQGQGKKLQNIIMLEKVQLFSVCKLFHT